MSQYILELDETEGMQLAQRAAERGYHSLVDYLRALVAADVLVDALREDWQDTDDDPELLETEFREGWHDAMTGNTAPIETLWDSLDNDE